MPGFDRDQLRIAIARDQPSLNDMKTVDVEDANGAMHYKTKKIYHAYNESDLKAFDDAVPQGGAPPPLA